MVRPSSAEVRRAPSDVSRDVSRDDVRHAVADAWSLLTEISASLAKKGPDGEPSAQARPASGPGWGELAELAGTLEMSSRALRLMLVRRALEAGRDSRYGAARVDDPKKN
jgi:hypothetical protein